ncbi:MAG: NUDIX domain-containing protein [Eubacteriales bacterium]|nr:NUDIX domain-containing protein [Eubacteriales bacterium]
MSFQQTGRRVQQRPKTVFMSLKSKLEMPGVSALLAPCTQHLDINQYARMLSGWRSMRQYHVYGFTRLGTVVAVMAVEEQAAGKGRLLVLSVDPRFRQRGMGRRLLVETFCSLKLEILSADTGEDTLGFYQRNHFEVSSSRDTRGGLLLYTCVLTKEALYAGYNHEYSSGAVLFCEKDGQRLYAVVTELSGNTGLPKGHVEPGESNEEAALREIYEETGIRATIVPGFEGELVYPQGRGMLKHFYYYLASFNPSQRFYTGDVVDAELLPYDRAMKKLSFMDVRLLLRRAEVFLSSGAFTQNP